MESLSDCVSVKYDVCPDFGDGQVASLVRSYALFEGYGHYGPGVCLGDGQTEAEGVPSQGGRGDVLLRCIPPYLT